MIADIVSDKPVSQDMKQNTELWGECISGALTLKEFLTIAQKNSFIGLTIHKDYLWKVVNNIRFYSFIIEGFKLTLPEESSCKLMNAVYNGPFSSVAIGSEIYNIGIPKKIDGDTASFLSSGPFASHFEILDPSELTSENMDSPCCD